MYGFCTIATHFTPSVSKVVENVDNGCQWFTNIYKYYFDVVKGAKSAEDVEFISVPEAMEKYSLTRDQLYHYVKTYKITKLRCGKYVKLNAKELAELFNPKIEL